MIRVNFKGTTGDLEADRNIAEFLKEKVPQEQWYNPLAPRVLVGKDADIVYAMPAPVKSEEEARILAEIEKQHPHAHVAFVGIRIRNTGVQLWRKT